MAMAAAHVAFRDALTTAGWEIASDYGVTHPYELTVRRGKQVRRLYVYAWNITGEGRGRVKKDRDDLDWRIQTTRPDENDLRSPPGFLAAGLGWKADQGVFAAFDVWVKRTTGKSSSVHITTQLINAADRYGWATEEREDGLECAFRPARVDDYLAWLGDRHILESGTVHLYSPPTTAGERAEFVIDRKTDWRMMALREGSQVVLRGAHGQLLDKSIWRIIKVETVRGTTEGGNNTATIKMTAELYGIIRKDSALLGGTA